MPCDISGEASDINNQGIVVGFSDDPPGPEGGPQAFTWQNGKTRPLEIPGENVFSMALGINDHGQIVGLADVVLPSDSQADTKSDAADDDTEANVKTLGFVWSKAKQSK